jgi:hypothetical protein
VGLARGDRVAGAGGRLGGRYVTAQERRKRQGAKAATGAEQEITAGGGMFEVGHAV